MPPPPPVVGDGPTPIRVAGLIRVPRPDRRELECERGREVEGASFGVVEVVLREPPVGAPEARFLGEVSGCGCMCHTR